MREMYVSLVRLFSLDSESAIIHSATTSLPSHIVTLLLTDKKDVLLCFVDKSQTKDDSPPKFQLMQVDWSSNELNKGCLVGFSEDGGLGLVVSESFNVFTINIHKIMENNFKGGIMSGGIVKQVFIGPRNGVKVFDDFIFLTNGVAGKLTSMVSWTNQEMHVQLAIASSSGTPKDSPATTNDSPGIPNGSPATPNGSSATPNGCPGTPNSSLGISAGSSGTLTILDISRGVMVGEMSFEEIERLLTYQDDTQDSKYLLIKTAAAVHRLLVDQKSLGYSWDGGEALSPESPNHLLDPGIPDKPGGGIPDNPGGIPGIVESRGRLSGLKQLSVEKITSLRNRLADRGRMPRTKSEDLTAPPTRPDCVTSQVGSCSCLSVENISGRQLLSAYYPSQCESLLLDAKLEPVQNSARTLSNLKEVDVQTINRTGNFFIVSTQIEDDQHLIFTSGSGDKIVNTEFQRIQLPANEQMRSVDRINLCQSSQQPNNTPTKKSAKKGPFSGLVCVTTDQNGETRTQVLQPRTDSKLPEKTEVESNQTSASPQENFKTTLHAQIDRLRRQINENLDSFVVVTNKHLYILDWTKHPVDLSLQLCIQGSIKQAEQLLSCLGLEKHVILEYAGDLKLCAGDYASAVNLYRLAGAATLKIALKLAVFGDVRQLLAFLEAALSNRNIDATHREKVHLGNLALISYFQQILKQTIDHLRADQEQQFLDFLTNNRLYDEELMVTQALDTQSWNILSRIVCLHGLQEEVGQGLVAWTSNFATLNAISPDKLLDHLGTQKDMLIDILLHADFLSGVCHDQSICGPIISLVTSLVPSLSTQHLVNLAQATNPEYPCFQPLLKSPSEAVGGLGSDILNLHLSALLLVGRGHDRFDPSLLKLHTHAAKELSPVPETAVITETCLSGGFSHTLYNQNGTLVCWGSDGRGATGLKPNYANYFVPSPVPFFHRLNLKVLQVSCGKNHSLALTSSGLYAWGSNQYGQLGRGDGKKLNCSRRPGRVDLNPLTTQIACGQFHCLALDVEGRVHSWGWGVHGQLGHDSIEDLGVPQQVTGLAGHVIVEIAAGYAHSLCRDKDGRLLTFGLGMFGQLGVGSTSKSLVPCSVDLQHPATRIAAGYFNSLALASGNVIYEWGAHPQVLRSEAQQRRKDAQLQKAAEQKEPGMEVSESPPCEPESLPAYLPPVPEPGEQHLLPHLVDTSNVKGDIVSMSCGSQHRLLVTEEGGVYTWGRNLEGQLGHGGRAPAKLPTRVIGLNDDFICSAVCGSDFSVCISESGSLYGWGSNSAAQLGRPPIEVEPRQEQAKVLMMKTSKRIVRLQHGLQNSCDKPKPVPGLQECGGIYAGQISKTRQDVSAREFYAELDTFLQLGGPPFKLDDNFADLDELDEYINRLIETYYCLLDTSRLEEICSKTRNNQVLSKLKFLDGQYLHSMEFALKSILSSEAEGIEDLAFDAFKVSLNAAHSSSRVLQNQLLRKLVVFHQNQNIPLSSLETRLLEETDDINIIVNIFFCPLDISARPLDSSAQTPEGKSEKPLVDLFSVGFCLKLGQRFVENTASKEQRIEIDGCGDEMMNPQALSLVLKQIMEPSTRTNKDN